MSDTSHGPQRWLTADGEWYPPEAHASPPTAPDVRRHTNRVAVASLVCSVVGIFPLFFGLTCVLGVVFGFVALRQIKRSDGVQAGKGLAVAGIVVGFSLVAIFVVIVFAITIKQGALPCFIDPNSGFCADH
jgi:uncharacterized membrane protein